jgi:hypothetical protein
MHPQRAFCAYTSLIVLLIVEPCFALDKRWKEHIEPIADASSGKKTRRRGEVCVSFKDAVCAETNRGDFVQVIANAFGKAGYQSVIAVFFGGRKSVSAPFPDEAVLRQSFTAVQAMSAPQNLPTGFPQTLFLYGAYGADAISSNCPRLTRTHTHDTCLVYLAIMGGKPEAQAHITLSHTLQKQAFQQEFNLFLDTLVAVSQMVSVPSASISSSSLNHLMLEDSKLRSEMKDAKTQRRKVVEEEEGDNRVDEPRQHSHNTVRQRLFLLGVATLLFGGSIYGASFFSRGGKRGRSISIDCSVGSHEAYSTSHYEKRSPSASPPRSNRALDRSRLRASPTPTGSRSPPGGVVRFLRRYSVE